jgi:DNA-binding MarR family transcriptional regulator
MQDRGLVLRQVAENDAGVLIVMPPTGREVLDRAYPVHAKAVRRHLLDRLTPDELRMLDAIATRLENDTF